MLACNDLTLDSYYTLREIVKAARPDDELQLVVERGSEKLNLELVVGRQRVGKIFDRVPYADEVETDRLAQEPGALELEKRMQMLEREMKSLRALMIRRR